ncbi:MAG: IPTL-CTERM sorting domain-containing protein [Planctomycetes bacterium]|nr:IPTL-CTERM sorting domain-containing protein [Planctomycetota bacterium]
MVRRLEDTTDLDGGSSTIDIEIIALSLVSVNPITVTFNGGQDPETWNVKVCLSDTEAQELGTMTITKTHTDGGVFDSLIPLRMKIEFTEVGGPGSGSLNTTNDFGGGFDLVATGSSWALLGGTTHNLTKASFGLVDFDGPINFDGDCDGVDEALLSATDDDSNFAPAIDASLAEPNCDPNSEEERAFANGAGHHDAYLASTDDSDGDGIPDECEGACCLGDKTCTLETPDQCATLGGAFKGKGLECGPVIKCLKPDGTIEISAELCCDQQGGIEIPTVSEWGLVALTLVLLTAGTIVLRRRAVAA